MLISPQIDIQKLVTSVREIADQRSVAVKIVLEERREKLRELEQVFRSLSADPIIIALQKYCKATGEIIVCTPACHKDEDLFYANVIALTGAGFRVHQRVLGSSDAWQSSNEMMFPLNRWLSLQLRGLRDHGCTAESVKATLYKKAQEISERELTSVKAD